MQITAIEKDGQKPQFVITLNNDEAGSLANHRASCHFLPFLAIKLLQAKKNCKA